MCPASKVFILPCMANSGGYCTVGKISLDRDALKQYNFLSLNCIVAKVGERSLLDIYGYEFFKITLFTNNNSKHERLRGGGCPVVI